MSTEFDIDNIVSVLTTLTVITIMLSAGLKLTFSQATWLLRRPRLLARSLVSVDLIVPAIALSVIFTLSGFLPVEVRIGIFLLAAAPGAPLAPKIAAQAGAIHCMPLV